MENGVIGGGVAGAIVALCLLIYIWRRKHRLIGRAPSRIQMGGETVVQHSTVEPAVTGEYCRLRLVCTESSEHFCVGVTMRQIVV